MAERKFSLIFKGYWRERNKGGIPPQSGVYCVYTCTYNKEEETVSLQKLLYIGEAENVRDRIANHDRKDDWEQHLDYGEQLCYSFASSLSANRERCEAALINRHEPPENIEYIDAFPFDRTNIITAGKNKFLRSNFSVLRV